MSFWLIFKLRLSGVFHSQQFRWASERAQARDSHVIGRTAVRLDLEQRDLSGLTPMEPVWSIFVFCFLFFFNYMLQYPIWKPPTPGL